MENYEITIREYSKKQLLKKFGEVVCSEIFGEIKLINPIRDTIKSETSEALEHRT